MIREVSPTQSGQLLKSHTARLRPKPYGASEKKHGLLGGNKNVTGRKRGNSLKLLKARSQYLARTLEIKEAHRTSERLKVLESMITI